MFSSLRYFLLSKFVGFFFKISFLFRELILATFIRISLRVRDYFSFSSSKNIFMYLLFLKDIFDGYGLPDWQFFSFTVWKILSTLFWPPTFFMRNLLSFYFNFSLQIKWIFLWPLPRFFLCLLVFKILIKMCLCMDPS